MPKRINEIGNRYGRLLVLEESPKRTASGTVFWKCQCDCGNITEVSGTHLRQGKIQSCGCLHKEIITTNEVGKKYGKLTVLQKAPSKNNRTRWICECECGNIVEVIGTNLRTGTTQSCGCSHIVDNRIGKVYGQLTVLRQLPNNYWECQCSCGNIVQVFGKYLNNGHKTSCGCLRSKGEQKIIQILQENNIMFEKEKTFENCRYPDTGGMCRFDFYLPNHNILIEYDGEQHFVGWGKETRDLKDIQLRDAFKTQWCQENNIKLIRIPYTEYNNINLQTLII